MSTEAPGAPYCHTCGATFENEVPSDRLTRDLLEMRELWGSIEADLDGMPKHVNAQHAASLGRLSGKCEQLRRVSVRAAQTADFMARTVTR